jgi:hypothetical protein
MTDLLLLAAARRSTSSEPAQTYTLGAADPGVPNQNLLLVRGVSGGKSTQNSYVQSSWSSTNQFPVTGQPAQGLFDVNGQNWSICTMYSVGTGITSAASSALQLSTASYTIECFVNVPTQEYNNDNIGFWNVGSSGHNGGYGPYANCSPSYWQFGFSCGNTAGTNINYTTSTLLNYGEWYHICVQRSGSTQYYYINGTYVGSFSEGTSAMSINCAVNPTFNMSNGNYGMISGFMSNIRIEYGTNVYPIAANFTVPTSPLASTGSTTTRFLTGQSPYLVDNGYYALAITNNGVTIGNYGPFASSARSTASGSIYFNGSTDGFETADNGSSGLYENALQMTTSGFFISAWIYPITFNSTSNSTIMANWGSTTATQGFAFGYNGNGTLQFQWCVGSTVSSASGAGTYNLVPYQWNYVLFNRGSTVGYLFVNGKLDKSFNMTGTTNNTGIYPTIGGPNTNLGWQGINGYLSQLEFSNVSFKTANFSISNLIVPPGQIPDNYGNGNNPMEWMNFSSGSVLDYSYSSSIYLSGSCGVSTAQQKFTSIPSIYCDGVGQMSYFSPTTNSAYPLDIWFNNFSNYTIEGWFYPTSNTGNIGLFGTKANASQYSPIELQYSGGTLTLIMGSSSTAVGSQIVSYQTMPLNAWSHIAVVRNGPYVGLYLNGQQQGVQQFYSYAENLSQFYVGGNMTTYSTGYTPFQGYIQEFRISTASQYSGTSFPVPTAPFSTT